MNAALVVLAAGRGLRAGGSVRKQFATDADGRTIVGACIAQALRALPWHMAIVVSPPDALDHMQTVLAREELTGVEVLAGADDRLDSMARGMQRVDADECPISVVHDGTRPLTPPDLFRGVVDLVRSGEVDAAWPAADAANTVLDKRYSRALPAKDLMVVSTPIAARTEDVKHALSSSQARSEPLSGLLARAGVRWGTIPDSLLNFKVTSGRDLRDAINLMSALGGADHPRVRRGTMRGSC